MASKALFILWICITTLPNPFLAGTKEEDADILRFIELYKKDPDTIPDVFLQHLNFSGREFIHPDDPNKVLRVYLFQNSQKSNRVAQVKKVIAQLTERSDKLGNQIPITQKLYRVLSYPVENLWTVTLELERFRDNLIEGIENDQLLRINLMNFAMRLDLYKQLAYTFQQYAELKMKNCNIEVQKILFKKTGDDFSTSPPLETNTGFVFVLSELMYSSPMDFPCRGGTLSTWDFDDSRGDIPLSDKCQKKIEIIGLGMLILKIETTALAITNEGFETAELRPTTLSDALKALPEAPHELFLCYEEKTPILNHSSFSILDTIFARSRIANNIELHIEDESVDFTNKVLQDDMAYIEKANAVIFEQRELERNSSKMADSNAKDKIVALYATFNKHIHSMFKPNDYTYGRPTAAETFDAFSKIHDEYVASTNSLVRDRVLVV